MFNNIISAWSVVMRLSNGYFAAIPAAKIHYALASLLTLIETSFNLQGV
jgi:hypothetical protein